MSLRPLESRNFLKPSGLHLWAHKLASDVRRAQEQSCGGKGIFPVGQSTKGAHVYSSLDIALTMRVDWPKFYKPRAEECLGKSWLIEGPQVRRRPLETPKPKSSGRSQVQGCAAIGHQ